MWKVPHQSYPSSDAGANTYGTLGELGKALLLQALHDCSSEGRDCIGTSPAAAISWDRATSNIPPSGLTLELSPLPPRAHFPLNRSSSKL